MRLLPSAAYNGLGSGSEGPKGKGPSGRDPWAAGVLGGVDLPLPVLAAKEEAGLQEREAEECWRKC